jgi:hypothetical protein
LFGLAHFDPQTGVGDQTVYAACAGVVLALLALRTGSIWPSFSVHAAVNAMPLLVPERVLPIPGFNMISSETLHQPWPLPLLGLALGGALLAWAWRIEYVGPP